MLEREDGFKGVRHFPKIVGDIGNRKTNLTKLEYLLALDNRAPPNPLSYPNDYLLNPNSSTNPNTLKGESKEIISLLISDESEWKANITLISLAFSFLAGYYGFFILLKITIFP